MNMSREEKLKTVLRSLHEDGDREGAQQELRQLLEEVSADELGRAESALIEEGINPKEIQGLCSMHAGVVLDQIVQPDPSGVTNQKGHPAYVFIKEIEGLRNYLNQIFKPLFTGYQEELLAGGATTSAKQAALLEGIDKLASWDYHYDRKENLMFPFLEENGITAPPKVMWGVDDEIRQARKEWKKLLEQPGEGNAKDIIEAGSSYLTQLEEMQTKEERILMPMLIENIGAEGWLSVAKGGQDYAYTFNDFDGARQEDIDAWIAHNDELISEVKKVGLVGAPDTPTASEDNPLKEGWLSFDGNGIMTVDEVRSAIDASEVDFTFIGADDKVRFFSESDHMIFKRPRTTVGRDVLLCHPPKSHPVVEELLHDFKSGKRTVERRFFRRGDQLVYVRYIAVFNRDKEYVGTLELTEDIEYLRQVFEDDRFKPGI